MWSKFFCPILQPSICFLVLPLAFRAGNWRERALNIFCNFKKNANEKREIVMLSGLSYL